MINACVGAAQNARHFFKYLKKNLLLKPHFVPTRTFLNKWKLSKESYWQGRDPNREKPPSDSEVLRGIDDPNFSKQFLKALREPDFKKSYKNFSTEFKKFCDEVKTKYENNFNFRIDSTEGRIDMLFTFETQKDIENFRVTSDSSFLQGYSSASFKLTQEKTGLFSGNICTDIPKDGNVKVAGYANIGNVMRKKSFYRENFFDWTGYSHLVFKIRGDGRTYIILINIYNFYEELQHMAYVHPLYTRGGPYWQIAKIPFSHFYTTSKGSISTRQNVEKSLHEIKRLGITAAGFDGPFKLEIDYIGLEFKEFHKDICPYESYHKN